VARYPGLEVRRRVSAVVLTSITIKAELQHRDSASFWTIDAALRHRRRRRRGRTSIASEPPPCSPLGLSSTHSASACSAG
jgi:hypothetical protein